MEIISTWFAQGLFIEGMDEDTIRAILTNSHSDIAVKNVTNGIIRLNNRKTIKCVSNYYTLSNGEKLTPTKDNHFCFKNQKALDCQSVGNYNCTLCHIRCLNKFNNNELKKLNK